MEQIMHRKIPKFLLVPLALFALHLARKRPAAKPAAPPRFSMAALKPWLASHK
jgi:hypothetical protein